jgi:hypothetical protein
MTATMIAPAPAGPLPTPAAPRRRRRWHRIAIPLGLAVLFLGGSIVAHELAEPDRSDPSFLSPAPATRDGHGGSRLAELLADQGVTVHRETSSAAALRRLWASPATSTLFVPAPEFSHGDYLWMMGHGRAGSRVVLVEPSDRDLREALPMTRVHDRRWATGLASPGPNCAIVDAGSADVRRDRYHVAADHDGPVDRCYDGSLLRMTSSKVEIVLVGSVDPFRDDLIDAHDNAGLATGLLAARPSVIWLDLHKPEPPAAMSDLPSGGDPTDPTFGRGGERGAPGDEPVPGPGGAQPPSEGGMAAPPSPYPSWLFPMVIALITAGVLLTVASGRRLGRPVTEPLPVVVHGAETALGRGRLYRRAKARGPALDVLRGSIRRRLALTLGLPSAVEAPELVAAVATRTGDHPDSITNILYGPEPEDDQDLHRRAVELIDLADRINPDVTKEHR